MRPLVKGAATAALGLLLVGMSPFQPLERANLPWSQSPDAHQGNRPPERPRSTVDTAEVRSTGRTIRVPAGGSLQAALDEAKGGDVIALEPGAVYRGPFRLPRKDGQKWIVIASAASGAGLPPAGQRVDPSHAPLMPKLVASSGPVFETEPAAHHYRFIGLDIAPAEGVFLYALMQLGADETDRNSLPHHLIVDRCYLHGDQKQGTRRGIAMNSRDTAVVDSYLSNFKEVGADSQAIAGWNGAGPFKIANNYLEAAGENVMFGGADPTIRDLVPADIEMRHNHLAKPLAWKSGEKNFEGVAWTVKNLFELKNARRVLVDGNLLEYNWPQAQNGFAILFTVRNQKGGAPWSAVEDVVFVNNLVRHVASGINVLGRDDNNPSQQTRRIAIRNNLFIDVGGAWGGGRLFQLLDGTSDVTIDHNTAFQTGSILFGGDHAPHTGFVFQNNIAPHNLQGIIGSGTGDGTPTLDRYFPRAAFRRNVIVGGKSAHYPPDNFYPASLEEVGFLRLQDGSYRPALAHRYAHAGTDGRDPGADLEAITQAMTGLTSIATAVVLPTGTSGVQAAAIQAIDDSHLWSAESIVFWVSFGLLGYIYLGYPLVARLRARLRPSARRRAPIEPAVSVVVVAHNEAERIAARIENLLALDYPRDRLEIVIGSDGSTDATVVRARRYEQFGVKVRAFPTRRGKSAVLNDLVPFVPGEIVVLADARQRFDAGALRALVANFADPTAGAVSGELILTTDRGKTTTGRGAVFYWRYEKFIRSTESRAGSMVGATGAIYAIRRELFEPIPSDTILDDVLIPLRIARRGYRVLFEPEARAYDRASATAREEFVRKARTIAGTFQLFAREPWLFSPFRNRLWFETVSHKALRLAIPVLHMALFWTNLALPGFWLYQCTMAAQLGFYTAALVGCAQRHAERRSIVLTVPYTMCLLSWATIVGFVRFITHRQHVMWEQVSATRIRS